MPASLTSMLIRGPEVGAAPAVRVAVSSTVPRSRKILGSFWRELMTGEPGSPLKNPACCGSRCAQALHRTPCGLLNVRQVRHRRSSVRAAQILLRLDCLATARFFNRLLTVALRATCPGARAVPRRDALRAR